MSRYSIVLLMFITIVLIVFLSMNLLNVSYHIYQPLYLHLYNQRCYTIWHNLNICLNRAMFVKCIRVYVENPCRNCGSFSKYYYYKAEDDSIFVLIRILIRNTGNNSIDIGDIAFLLVTNKGIFDRYILGEKDISYTLTPEDVNNSIEYQPLYIPRWFNENEEVSGDILFKIPIDIRFLVLRISISNSSIDVPLTYN